jgi:hypothetical protein
MISDEHSQTDGIVGSRDGLGAGDHDQPYRFGRRPRAAVPYPFSTREYLHLLVMRGRIQDGVVGRDDLTLVA